MRMRLIVMLMLLGAGLLVRGDGVAAGAPPPMARELAAGAVVALEIDNLAGELRRWRGSRLRKVLERTAAMREMERSGIFRKLTKRLTKLEGILGFELTLDRLILMAGRRAAFGLYDVSDTEFVMVAETTAADARRTPLWQAREKMERREHAGLQYFYVPPTKQRLGFALALVGNRLVLGNDLDPFRRTLLLAAKAAGVATQSPRGKAAGGGTPSGAKAASGTTRSGAGPGLSLGDDPRYRKLLALTPRDTAGRVWVDQSSLAGTPQFDSHWIFEAELANQIDAALLGVRFAAGETVETRVYEYLEAKARPRLAAPPRGRVLGHTPLAPMTKALGFAPFAAARATTAAAAASQVGEVTGISSSKAVKRLRELLAPARPRRLLEASDPATRKGLRAYDRSAVAVLLESPASLDAAAFEKAVADGVLGDLAVAGTNAQGFADQDGARVLRIELVKERAPTIKRASDAVLVIGTDPGMVAKLVAALPGAQSLMQPEAPAAWRLDVRRASAYYTDLSKLLAARTNWSRSTARFFSQSVGGLPPVWRDVRELVSVSYLSGDHYLEEVHALER